MRPLVPTLVLAIALAGCFGTLQPATATFKGVDRPVLLGPIDRIGGGTPLVTRNVTGYEGEANAHYARSESQTTVTESTGFDNLTMVKDAIKALANAGPNSDLRVTMVRAWAKGFISIVKNQVLLEGAIVTVEGAR